MLSRKPTEPDSCTDIVDPYVYFYLSWIDLAPSDVFRTNGEKYWLERTRKNLQLVLITLNGLKPNIWSEDLVDVSLSAEEIFGSLH